MPPRLPAKPRSAPLVTRTLVAMALGAPACGSIVPPPNRIGPPPIRIGPPPCFEVAFVVGTVFVGEQHERLANQPVTLSIGGAERIITTDAQGQFKLDYFGQDSHSTITARVPGYDTVDALTETYRCEGRGELLILLKPAGSPDIPHLQAKGNGAVIYD